jgi:DNA-binding response OmpR family regulator
MSEVDLDLTGCKILVTDDVPANLDILFQALDSEGYNVHVASDGPTALKVAQQSHPDLILLDVMMPGIDGYETCRQLKAQSAIRGIPVVFLTARDDLEGIVEGFESGGVDYITKPFKKEEVLVRIQTHLERAILARRLASINEELELKVKERTADLVQKVRELEGKDRIAQHLLTFHSLEETLAVVLEVVISILELDQAVVYLCADGEFRPAAAIGLVGEDLGGRDADRFAAASPSAQALQAATQRLEPVLVAAAHPAALVPIVREGEILGLIEVENPRSGRQIGEGDLSTLSSFGLQAAVAVQDAKVRQDPAEWEDQLDEILEIEQEISDAERDAGDH